MIERAVELTSEIGSAVVIHVILVRVLEARNELEREVENTNNPGNDQRVGMSESCTDTFDKLRKIELRNGKLF